MYSKILKNLIYPCIEIRYPPKGRSITNLKLLEKTQWWEPSKLKQFQQKRLQALLKHAYKNVPYYHKLFNRLGLKPEDIKNTDDLHKLPILTKEIIRKNFNDLTAKNYSKDQLTTLATSGSTGEPMKLFIDIEWNAWNMAAAYREWSWAGYHMGNKIAYLWSASHEISHQKKLKVKISNFINKRIMLDAYNMTEKTLEDYTKILKKFKPKIINAYPSAAYLIGRYMLERGIEDIKLIGLLTSCEMLFNHQREIIEKAFHCEVFDYYSGRDTTLHAAECPQHSGYHLTIENAVVEFIKDDEHVAPGEVGKLVITDLSNYPMPFIRYEIGDLAIPSDEKCPCGRSLPLIKEISGRIIEMITTKDGRILPGNIINIPFFNSKGIKQYQFIQKTKDNALLKIVKGEQFVQTELDEIIKQIKKQIGDIKIKVEFVQKIPPTKTGKHRLVLSEVEVNI